MQKHPYNAVKVVSTHTTVCIVGARVRVYTHFCMYLTIKAKFRQEKTLHQLCHSTLLQCFEFFAYQKIFFKIFSL